MGLPALRERWIRRGELGNWRRFAQSGDVDAEDWVRCLEFNICEAQMRMVAEELLEIREHQRALSMQARPHKDVPRPSRPPSVRGTARPIISDRLSGWSGCAGGGDATRDTCARPECRLQRRTICQQRTGVPPRSRRMEGGGIRMPCTFSQSCVRTCYALLCAQASAEASKPIWSDVKKPATSPAIKATRYWI